MMKHFLSRIRPAITLEYIKGKAENQVFDCKLAAIESSQLAKTICAFANADGGTVVIGVHDRTRKLEGINGAGETKINELLNTPLTCCRPMPRYRYEYVDVVNERGVDDRLLMLHVEVSSDQVIRTANESVYLRIGDRNHEMKGDNLRQLEYSKNIRHYEDEICPDATLDDLDVDLLQKYKNNLNAENLSNEQVLQARGFLRMVEGKAVLTNAAVLLFAQNVARYYPNCRVRFLRFMGNAAESGARYNVIKDVSIEGCILKILPETLKFIRTQLRDFTALDPETAKFISVPEYPEFAWSEGIVNAITHRAYSLSGSYIRVDMYEDRLEINSPGDLPSLVTVENIKYTRYSRNPNIARVLSEFGWVRELNEGVNRIYEDMNSYFLDAPAYSEPRMTVKLVLRNNIEHRVHHISDYAQSAVSSADWSKMDEIEKKIVVYLSSRMDVKTKELAQYLNRSHQTVVKRLNALMQKGIVESSGGTTDPKRTYALKCARK